MALPPSVLQHVEQHGCFTGCYAASADVQVFFHPAQPPSPATVVSCQDCLKGLSVPISLLPAGTTGYSLADQLSRHVRARRGYALSLSGYHTQGPAFWFSAVYWANGLFLLNGERSRNLGQDLELLLLAFRHGILKPPDPAMLDPKLYAVQTVYVDPRQPPPAVTNKQSLLGSPLCRTQPVSGWQKLTLAEFLPIVNQTTAVAAPIAPNRKPLKLGDRCPTCGAEVRVRSLLNQTYVGCLC
jgi:hypothetical protein